MDICTRLHAIHPAAVEIFQSGPTGESVNTTAINTALWSCLYFVTFIKYAGPVCGKVKGHHHLNASLHVGFLKGMGDVKKEKGKKREISSKRIV